MQLSFSLVEILWNLLFCIYFVFVFLIPSYEYLTKIVLRFIRWSENCNKFNSIIVTSGVEFSLFCSSLSFNLRSRRPNDGNEGEIFAFDEQFVIDWGCDELHWLCKLIKVLEISITHVQQLRTIRLHKHYYYIPVCMFKVHVPELFEFSWFKHLIELLCKL